MISLFKRILLRISTDSGHLPIFSIAQTLSDTVTSEAVRKKFSCY